MTRRLTATVLVAALAWVGLVTGPASALPPGGAGSSTAGTSSTVSPTRLAPGATLAFTLRGFPAGETVSVKFDDGAGYGDQTIQGSGVVYQQKITAKGTVSGSFTLPASIAAGKHWLRFLASQEFTDAKGNVGVNGFTNKSPLFTVAVPKKAPGSTAGSSGEKTRASDDDASSSTDETGSSTDQGDESSRTTTGTGTSGQGDDPTSGADDPAAPAGTVVTARPQAPSTASAAAPDPADSAAPSDSANPEASEAAAIPATTAAPAEEDLAAAPQDSGSGFPTLGVGVLVAVLVLGGLGAWFALRRPRRAPGA